ncbi:gametogenetin-binding protein 2-like [Drosophila kikkawai]|uniref:Gametogenetin-binding protein 2-like n=1 Tax=Drosophila kikkawai TaxID=30033 RepID=A0A6P4J9N7_DROKI|nr:gametogenetin-binding protein 2-like [Drosophila kikkawai]
MARLTKVYNTDDDDSGYVGRRNLPLVAGDKLMMLMDLNSKGLVIDSPMIRGRDLEEFSRKFKLLTEAERRQSLEIDCASFMAILNQCVQCVGCRRRVERLFHQLTESGHRTLDPLELRPTNTLGIVEEKLKTPQALGTLLYRHHEVLNNLLDNKLRNKTRCVLHSLDAFRAKPFSETWREVWSAMKSNCRNELTIIETKELHDVLENYLKKHKFCSGCRTKIERAYKILIGEISAKEKGYAVQLYAHIRKCVPDQHIHVNTNKIEFLDALIKRAEPEVNGSYSKLRERHAKTLEIAQEEVLTCVGMIMYERLRRIYVNLREEERACQVLAAVGVHALCRSFDTFVEQKQGISNLELLYQEISRAERAKQLKREQKKLKKKKKKDEKKNLHRQCEDAEANESDEEADEQEEEESIELEIVELEQEEEMDADEEKVGQSDPGADDGIVLESSHQEPETTQLTSKPTKSKPKKQSKKKKQKQSAGLKKAEGRKQEHHPLASNTQQPLDDDHDHLDVASCISSSVVAKLNGEDKCEDCLAPIPNCPCEQDVRDSGYGSDPTSHADSRTSSVVSSPEGSEVSCSDGLCNHDGPHDEDQHQHGMYGLASARNSYVSDLLLYGNQSRFEHKFSLLQMWDDFDDYDDNEEDEDEDETYYIPQDVVLAFKCHSAQVQRQREQLRATLRANFESLCLKRGVQMPLKAKTSKMPAPAAVPAGHINKTH